MASGMERPTTANLIIASTASMAATSISLSWLIAFSMPRNIGDGHGDHHVTDEVKATRPVRRIAQTTNQTMRIEIKSI